MKQLGEITVRDYMTEEPIVVDDTARLTSAIRLMDQKDLSVVPVVDEQGDLVGVLSNSDLIGMMHDIQGDLSAMQHVNMKTREFLLQMLTDQGDNRRVRDVMTSPVETIKADANLVLAAKHLDESQLHHLPVVDSNGQAIGILAASDLVRAIADNGALAAG